MLKLANGKRLTLLANDPKKNIYIHKVELNGKQIDTNFITYAQLMEGGELRFTLSDKPDKSRGISKRLLLILIPKKSGFHSLCR